MEKSFLEVIVEDEQKAQKLIDEQKALQWDPKYEDKELEVQKAFEKLKIAKDEMVGKPEDVNDKMWEVAGGDPAQQKAILQNKTIYELCKLEPRQHPSICATVDTSGSVPKKNRVR